MFSHVLLLSCSLIFCFAHVLLCSCSAPLMSCSAQVLITLVPRPNHEFRAFLVGGPDSSSDLVYLSVLANFKDDICRTLLNYLKSVSRLGPEILASKPINFLTAHVWSYEAVSTDCTSCTTLCTVVQSFSSEQEIDSHMFHMSTSWSKDLVSCQFLSDLRTSNILNVNICKQN